MKPLTTSLWRTAAPMVVAMIVFLSFLSVGPTFTFIDKPVTKAIGLGLVFLAVFLTPLIWSYGPDGATPSWPFKLFVGCVAWLILALAVGMAGLLTLNANSFQEMLGIAPNEGMVWVSMLFFPALALAFYGRYVLPGKLALIAGSVAALAWFLWVGVVLVHFLL